MRRRKQALFSDTYTISHSVYDPGSFVDKSGALRSRGRCLPKSRDPSIDHVEHVTMFAIALHMATWRQNHVIVRLSEARLHVSVLVDRRRLISRQPLCMWAPLGRYQG